MPRAVCLTCRHDVCVTWHDGGQRSHAVRLLRYLPGLVIDQRQVSWRPLPQPEYPHACTMQHVAFWVKLAHMSVG